ncbi:MAG: hypothetical protein LBC41_17115, partial [Clostridiales bacterium]|nr:hypothetical protein [Clostridiales bacterium]
PEFAREIGDEYLVIDPIVDNPSIAPYAIEGLRFVDTLPADSIEYANESINGGRLPMVLNALNYLSEPTKFEGDYSIESLINYDPLTLKFDNGATRLDIGYVATKPSANEFMSWGLALNYKDVKAEDFGLEVYEYGDALAGTHFRNDEVGWLGGDKIQWGYWAFSISPAKPENYINLRVHHKPTGTFADVHLFTVVSLNQ